MLDQKDYYNKLRASDLNALVGGSDPEQVGDFCRGIINRYIAISQDIKLLDFGCGPGRVLASLLKQEPNIRKLVGFDIMGESIDFCLNNIATVAENCAFELINDRNEHYQRHVGGAAPKDLDFIARKYQSYFDGIYAFSVFTHIDEDDFERTLRFLSQVIAPDGKILLTAFILTPFSRSKIATNAANFKFDRPKMADDGKIFVGDSDDKLAFIAYDLTLIEEMVYRAGLAVSHIEYGSWRGVQANTLQDVIVCKKINQ